jgi:hypothetical protein
MLVLNQSNSFVSYAAQKVIKLADSNPNDISRPDLIRLKLQLKIFVDHMRKHIGSIVSIILVSSLICLLKEKTMSFFSNWYCSCRWRWTNVERVLSKMSRLVIYIIHFVNFYHSLGRAIKKSVHTLTFLTASATLTGDQNATTDPHLLVTHHNIH